MELSSQRQLDAAAAPDLSQMRLSRASSCSIVTKAGQIGSLYHSCPGVAVRRLLPEQHKKRWSFMSKHVDRHQEHLQIPCAAVDLPPQCPARVVRCAFCKLDGWTTASYLLEQI